VAADSDSDSTYAQPATQPLHDKTSHLLATSNAASPHLISVQAEFWARDVRVGLGSVVFCTDFGLWIYLRVCYFLPHLSPARSGRSLARNLMAYDHGMFGIPF